MVCGNLKLPASACNARPGAREFSKSKRSHGCDMGKWMLAGAALMALSVPAAAVDQKPLTVVELFQSQGCSDCPPANANVMALSGRPDILALSFGVTYWDYLGWK